MRHIITAACCLVLFSACEDGTTKKEAVHIPFDPVDRIENSPRVEASIVHRFGSAEGKDMLGGPADVNVSEDGRIHLLDFSMRQLKVFSPDGSLENSHPIQQGEGPGEASWPSSLTLTGDESAYFMFDMNLKRLTVFDRALEVQNVSNPRHEPFTLTRLGDRQILGVIVPWRLNSDSLLHVWDLDGNHVRSFLQGNPVQKELIFDRDMEWSPTTTIASSGNRVFVTHGFPVDLEFYEVDADKPQLIRRYYRDYGSDGDYEKDFYSVPTESGGSNEATKYYASSVCANANLVIQVLLDSKERRTYFNVHTVDGDHIGIVDIEEELDLEFPTICTANSVSDDNVVYVRSMKEGYPQIVGIQLDLPGSDQ